MPLNYTPMLYHSETYLITVPCEQLAPLLHRPWLTIEACKRQCTTKRLKVCISLTGNISELQSISCHMRSHSVTQNR